MLLEIDVCNMLEKRESSIALKSKYKEKIHGSHWNLSRVKTLLKYCTSTTFVYNEAQPTSNVFPGLRKCCQVASSYSVDFIFLSFAIMGFIVEL